MNSTPSRTHSLGLLFLSAAATSVAAQGTFPTVGEVVLATGQQCPGFPVGITVSTSTGVDQPVMDQNGTLLFRARLADTGGVGTLTTSNDRCLYIGRANGDLAVAAQADDPAPGIPGATLRGFSATAGSGTFGAGPSYRISPFGEILYFHSNIYDAGAPANTPTTSDQCLFWGPAGGLIKVLREGEEVPFYGAGSLINWGTPSTSNWWAQHLINASGQITVANILELSGPVTADTQSILATGFPGALTLISREGDVMVAGPNLLGGEVVTTASGSNLASELAMNEAGQVLHDMKFSSTVGTASVADDACLALYTPGSGDVVIAREGQDAPGFAPGTVQFGSPSNGWIVYAADGCLTSAGETFLLAYLIGTGVTANVDDQALYVGGAAGWTKLAQRNDVTPLGGSITYNNFSNSSMTINSDGTMAFSCQLNGTVGTTDNTAVFYGTAGGGFTKVVQEDDMFDASNLPGLQAGPWFAKDQYNLGGSSTLRINGRGQMLFHLQLWNAAHTTTITPLVSFDPTLGLRLVLDTTDMVTTGVGTSAWTGALSLAATAGSCDGGGYAWFNNSGDWCGRLTLTPSTSGFAIVRSHVGTMVCEPSSVPASGGVPHNFHIDAGPSHPFELYVVLATSLGTRPGFVSPFGPQNIPLNPDPLWTDLSLNAANSVVWINNLGITDASGKGIGAAGFVMPAGFPGFAGTTLHHVCVLLDFTLAQTHVGEPSAVKLY